MQVLCAASGLHAGILQRIERMFLLLGHTQASIFCDSNTKQKNGVTDRKCHRAELVVKTINPFCCAHIASWIELLQAFIIFSRSLHRPSSSLRAQKHQILHST